MTQLTKFQQYIKDLNIEDDLDGVKAVVFIQDIKELFSDEYEILMDEIQNSIDARTQLERALSFNGYGNACEYTDQIKAHVNKLINETQELIEDIRINNHTDDEDCMDIQKRADELAR